MVSEGDQALFADAVVTAFDESVARTTLETNVYGTHRVTRHFLPLVKSGGSVVMVGSCRGGGGLHVTCAGCESHGSAAPAEERLSEG